MSVDRAELKKRIDERNAADRQRAKILILTGIPFALLSLLFLTVALFVFVYGVLAALGFSTGLHYNTAFFVGLGIAAAAILLDTLLHPSEDWVRQEYYLRSGAVSGPEFGGWFSDHMKGVFSGMPLMTNMADTRNWAMHGKLVSSGCANIILSGPRNIRKGVELLILARRRGHPAVAASTGSFLEWMSGRDGCVEEELRAQLEGDPQMIAGFALANELGYLGRRSDEEGRKTVFVR